MIFYEINGKVTGVNNGPDLQAQKKKRNSGFFDHRGMVRPDVISAVSSAADSIAAKTAEDKMRMDIGELKADRFTAFAAASFDALKKHALVDTLKELFSEIGVEGEISVVEEITEARYSNLLDAAHQKDFCRSKFAVKEQFEIDSFDYDFSVTERKLVTVADTGAAQAKKLMCKNLEDEVARIYANQKYGNPVHYVVQTDKMDSAKEIYDFLLAALHKNGRIKRSVVHIWNSSEQDEDSELSAKDIQKMFEKSEYGAVVIKSCFEESAGDQISSDYKKIRMFAEAVQKNKKNVLTVLCVEKRARRITSAWMEALEGIPFITLEEGIIFKDDAKIYLSVPAEKDGVTEEDLTMLFHRLEDGKGYTRAELGDMYLSWYVGLQKAREFPQYESISAAETKSDKAAAGAAYGKLKNLIGLSKIKEQVDHIIAFARVQQRAVELGLKTEPVTRHMVFTGGPGTAKTTVARLFAQVMKDNELLLSGKFVECGRADLVDRYLGGTAPRVRDKFKEARGGVLFIDEAYSLCEGRDGLYGDEAINTIVQEMENHRDTTIVIFAGYKREMEAFISRNSGLKSRVAHYVDFPDYTATELVEILELMAGEQGMHIDGDKSGILEIMRAAVKRENFGNGRFARNLLDKARLKQAGRVIKLEHADVSAFATLAANDFEMPEEYQKSGKATVGFLAINS
ncbi:MAG: AAA family ATPase [Firmicutes bacterium]|nr:AAA family ATPase [Bacillota bacterium]